MWAAAHSRVQGCPASNSVASSSAAGPASSLMAMHVSPSLSRAAGGLEVPCHHRQSTLRAAGVCSSLFCWTTATVTVAGSCIRRLF